MDEQKDKEKMPQGNGWCPMCWRYGYGGHQHHHWHPGFLILRILIAIIVIAFAFAVGVKLGELRADIYYSGYGGYGYYPMQYMMNGWNGGYAAPGYDYAPYGAPMMQYYYNPGTTAPPAHPATPPASTGK